MPFLCELRISGRQAVFLFTFHQKRTDILGIADDIHIHLYVHPIMAVYVSHNRGHNLIHILVRMVNTADNLSFGLLFLLFCSFCFPVPFLCLLSDRQHPDPDALQIVRLTIIVFRPVIYLMEHSIILNPQLNVRYKDIHFKTIDHGSVGAIRENFLHIIINHLFRKRSFPLLFTNRTAL